MIKTLVRLDERAFHGMYTELKNSVLMELISVTEWKNKVAELGEAVNWKVELNDYEAQGVWTPTPGTTNKFNAWNEVTYIDVMARIEEHFKN